ncbi:DUF3177 family protein [Dolichospermum circinale CS-534/05]|uniref:DUF3177 family protein n=1 Tax=Dolichospermum circinale TaxID=109265 RepID=UPI00232F9639|nr:DUF3177 family protein [Dolichospermum circinale]MDB9452872.1 DUF3177 family protein [Dolichospermum circinale CS-541/06]MDB9463917.1 DUF3177 family protein [Dolichospermum circinale CS-541/04]MDB9489808.1 DUF3177 family protein [Dolichospermum circinale CS-534/05]MDB9546749.1 DUF3177 family protein [Dolichospermum circinale CS-1031]
MTEVWFRPYVWMDYWLELLFVLIIPIILLIWVFVQKSEAMQRLLTIYWRVASLLAISIYLMIGGFGVGFISALMARILIPIALWFWVDINDEIEYHPQGPLKLVFTSWRWATTVYCSLGALALLPFLRCAFSANMLKTPYCSVWLEAPLVFKDYFHHNSTPAFLGFLGIVTLGFYIVYLSYFVAFKLSRYGRSTTH